MLDITKVFGSCNMTACSRTPQYIAIHYTAGTRSTKGIATSVAKMFNNSSRNASADFIVDDGSIVQFNPDMTKKFCWAVGGIKYNTKGGSLYGIAKNANTISIEMCSTNNTGTVTNANDSHWYFTDAVVNNTVDLVKYLMKLYNIPVSRVIRHYDVTGKPCPGIIGWNKDTGSEAKWNNFLSRLIDGNEVANQTTASTTQTSTSASSSNQQQFIDKIATYVKKYAGNYSVKVYSPIIAQACLESAYGTSELATKANNYFGLKYNSQVSNKSAYIKVGSEQNANGTYTSSTMSWCNFNDMESGVKGYFEFLFKRSGITRYNGLIGITDPQKYLETIKAAGYATSLKYVENNMNVITKWNLTKYDTTNTTSASTSSTTTNNNTSTSTNTSYLIRIKVNDLKIRKGPGTSYAAVGAVNKGEVYTIVETKNNWGKLKSGAGWISLYYTEKK